MIENFEPLLDIEQAAKLLRLHPKTVQRLCRQGFIPAIRMGKYWRFRASSLDTYLNDQIKLWDQSRCVKS